MSNDERNFLKRWLLAGAGVLLTQTLAVSGVFIADHYSLSQLKEEMAVVKPRVEELWWTSTISTKRKDL